MRKNLALSVMHLPVLPVFLVVFAAFLSISSWYAASDLSVAARRDFVSCSVSSSHASSICTDFCAQLPAITVPVFALDSVESCACKPFSDISWNVRTLRAPSFVYLRTTAPEIVSCDVSNWFFQAPRNIDHLHSVLQLLGRIQCHTLAKVLLVPMWRGSRHLARFQPELSFIALRTVSSVAGAHLRPVLRASLFCNPVRGSTVL